MTVDTATAVAFAPPSAELIEHAMRELDYQERLVGYKMTPSAGNAATDLYNLPQAVLFLVGTPWDAPMLSPGFKGALNWVDVARLVAWLRDTVGDADLADAIAEQALELPSYKAQSDVIVSLVSERMLQYQDVTKALRDAEAAAGGEDAEQPPSEA